MADSISISNPPNIEYTTNNGGGNDLKCLNYRFYLKRMGKEAASFRCSGKKCYASISLKTQIDGGKTSIVEPFEITNLNWKHVDGCLPKNDDHFVVQA